MSEKFKKFDGKKNRLELIEPDFIIGLGKVLSFGAEKYAAWNWRKVDCQEDIDRIKGAMLRHMMAYMSGEKIDPETGLSHLHHISCNSMFLNYFDENGLREEPSMFEGVPTVPHIDDAKVHTKSSVPDKKFRPSARRTEYNEGYVHAIRRWVENSTYVYLHIDRDGHFIFRNVDTGTEFAMKTYEDFFDWLVRTNPELYVKNGGSRAYAEKVKDGNHKK